VANPEIEKAVVQQGKRPRRSKEMQAAERKQGNESDQEEARKGKQHRRQGNLRRRLALSCPFL
jgi:hypothetical protein